MSEAKCSCQHCNGHIAFPAEMAGQMSACPHCGLETKLVIPNVTKAPANSPPQNVSVEIKRGVSPLGIASLVLGIIACIFCWIPLLGLLVLPLALIGLLLAVAGLIMAGVSKKTGFAFPVSGLIVCVLSGFIAIAITGSVAAAFAHRKQTSQEQVSNSGQQAASSAAGDWTRFSIVKQGDIQIEVSAVNISPVWIGSANPNIIYPYSRERYLQFHIKIKNTSSTKKVDFQTWRGTMLDATYAASLTDNYDNNYKRIAATADFDENYSKPDSTLYPNDMFTDVLVFEKPVANVKWLHLELPAENFGGTGKLRFEIPASTITN